MGISFQVLGEPGNDNALFVKIESGQQISRLIFDCGDGCVSKLPIQDLLAFDHLFFSHLPMDHVGGFDQLFRPTYNRENRRNEIWGPEGTSGILHHRFRAYLWNLHGNLKTTWFLHDIEAEKVVSSRLELNEAFERVHPVGSRPRAQVILDDPNFTVDALRLNHGTTSIGYIVREKPRQNIDSVRMRELGLSPGPWLKQLKDLNNVDGTIEIEGKKFAISELRKELIVETRGDSIAYFTDFILDDASMDSVAQALIGCKTLVCECQYRAADQDLAKRHSHMITTWTGELAKRAGVEQLLLFHLSVRYSPPEWVEMLNEVKAIFPNTSFPASWNFLGQVVRSSVCGG